MKTKPIFTDTDRRRLGHLLMSEQARSETPWYLLDELEWQLEESVAVRPKQISEKIVTMNSIVRLLNVNTSLDIAVTVVYPADVELVDGGVSVLDPLGSRLIGLEVGDILDCDQHIGRGPWRIIEISYQPEREGAFHL